MNRKLVALGTCLALLFSIIATVSAHTITVDGQKNDWFAAAPPRNSGYVARNASQQGEFFWRDALGDQRIISTNTITQDADLSEFRVTADATYLYLLLKARNLTTTTGPRVVEFQVAIDTTSGGNTALVDGAATNVNSNAAWEYLVQTRFKNGNVAPPLLYTAPNTSSSTGLSAALFAGSDDSAEIRVPWDKIGGLPSTSALNQLRFAVATLYSDRSAPADGLFSRVIDTMNPTQDTTTDLGDDTLDYYVDVLFNSQGEVVSPLLISEFVPNPSGSDTTGGNGTKTEWTEIFNPNSFDVPLNTFKFGDAVSRNTSSTDGMFRFPSNSSIAANGFVIVANEPVKFANQYPLVTAPVFGVISSTPSASRMTKYSAWAGDSVIDLDNGPNTSGSPFEEQVVLLDDRDTIVDMATYATASTPAASLTFGNVPIIIPDTGVPDDTSYQRCPTNHDTNNNAFDFVAKPLVEQTPGAACVIPPDSDLFLTKVASTSVGQPGAQVVYTLSFGNQGGTAAASVSITDTLPTGLSCVSQSASAGVTFTGNCGNNTLSWTLNTLVPSDTGTITLTTTINNGVAPNTTLTNHAGISSPGIDFNPSNNTFDASITTSGPGVLNVSTTLPATVTPNTTFEYTISYANLGASDASNVQITDVLPAGFTLVNEDSPSADWNNATTGNLVWTIPTLGAGETGTITLNVRVTAKSGATNHTITISGSGLTTQTLPRTVTVGQRNVYIPLILR